MQRLYIVVDAFAKAMMGLCDRNILAKSETLGKIRRSLNIKISATPSQQVKSYVRNYPSCTRYSTPTHPSRITLR
ncbi:hypothetical protein [Nostoc sp.]|uniref:hypothetical protein n=1 Tax=Nostoc sp. TaxID=1180 RepID=UPI002FF9F054